MSRNKAYYHIDQKPQRKGNKKRVFFASFVGFLLLIGGTYVFTLTQSPDVIADSTETLKSKEDKLVSDNQNFVKIESLNLLIPFNQAENEQIPVGGAWWRFPERGNPAEGGNFMLCGQRFKFGVTPNQTKENSPFYHIEKLEKDDKVDIYYEGQWYSYQISEKKSTEPNAVGIEDASEEARLTLYACLSNGSVDGPVVLIANPIVRPDSVSSEDKESGSNILL